MAEMLEIFVAVLGLSGNNMCVVRTGLVWTRILYNEDNVSLTDSGVLSIKWDNADGKLVWWPLPLGNGNADVRYWNPIEANRFLSQTENWSFKLLFSYIFSCNISAWLISWYLLYLQNLCNIIKVWPLYWWGLLGWQRGSEIAWELIVWGNDSLTPRNVNEPI